MKEDQLWLIGAGNMAYDYAKVLTTLQFPYIIISRGEEKAKILEELANSRISVLLGPAGTGKTTVISILCSIDAIKTGRVLLLAPTGKARVRMETLSLEYGVKAFTLAQFLGKHERYDYKTMTYHLSNTADLCSEYETVIIDESSMLTEEMLAVLLDSLEGVKRIILAGDYRQLPPIGPGRPFVDIITHLIPENIESKFPRVADNYCAIVIFLEISF